MSMIINPYAFGGGSPPASVYWSPTIKSSHMTLSEASDRLATNDNNAWEGVLSITSHTSGKWYAEVQRGGTPGWAHIHGLRKTTTSASMSTFCGQDADGWGLQTDNLAGAAAVLNNGAGTGATAAPPIGDGGYVRIAYDATSGSAWLGNETVWAGGGDPAAGTSPTFTLTAGTALHVMGSTNGNGTNARLRTDAADFGGTIPTGFSAWG